MAQSDKKKEKPAETSLMNQPAPNQVEVLSDLQRADFIVNQLEALERSAPWLHYTVIVHLYHKMCKRDFSLLHQSVPVALPSPPSAGQDEDEE